GCAKSKPQDSIRPVDGNRQCVVIARSPGRCPRPSSTSSSGGQPPSLASIQNAGHTPVPAGTFERISKYPYFCENEFCEVRMPETYSLLNSACFNSGGVRLATIESTPSLTLKGSSPSGAVERPL